MPLGKELTQARGISERRVVQSGSTQVLDGPFQRRPEERIADLVSTRHLIDRTERSAGVLDTNICSWCTHSVYRQRSLDDLGTPLSDTTFCVVDFETTGTDPRRDLICEIGAVKVRGGEVLGTFQTLVNPGIALPPRISVITGLTDAVLAPAPRIEQVLSSLRSFIGDAVFVAHNASFDLGFLRAALARQGFEEFRPTVVDTLAVARRLLRDEVRNFRLGTLAERFGIEHRPSHRALDDALATCDLLHLLIERASGWGVTGIDDLVAVASLSGHPQAGKLRLTDGLPRRPGVYMMIGESGEVTYVGKATNLRQRVRSYFGGDERRSVQPMLRGLTRVDHLEMPDPIAAEVIERRLIAALAPRHNRVGRRRRRPVYVRLDTNELWPRLSVVYQTKAQGTYLGPLQGRHQAEQVIEALQTAYPIRRCTTRIGPRHVVDPDAAPCSAAQLGVAPCPCTGLADVAAHDRAVQSVTEAMRGETGHLIESLGARMGALAAQQRFEEAAAVRDRLNTAIDAARRVNLVNVLRAAGRCRIAVGNVVHSIDDGILVTGALLPADSPASEPVDPDAERLLLARLLQRAAVSGSIQVIETDGSWGFPIDDVGLDRLPESDNADMGGDADGVDFNDAHTTAAE